MNATLLAEWTKLRTLPSTAWLLAGVVALTVGTSTVVAAALHVSPGAGQDPTKLSLDGIYAGQTVVAVLAVLALSEEYGTGMIRTTFAAMPRRWGVLGAKAANVAGLTAVAAVLAVAGCLVIGRLMLPGDGLGPSAGYPLVSIAHGATMRAAGGSVLYLVLLALLSLGIAAAVRDTAVAIGVVLGLLYLPLILAGAVGDPLRRHVLQVAPMTAGLAIQATAHLASLPIAPWAGLGVLAGWATGALLLGGLLLGWRDA